MLVSTGSVVILHQSGMSTPHVRKSTDTLFMDNFASFVERFRLTKEFSTVGADLLEHIHAFPHLRYAAIAIGALEASRRDAIEDRQGMASPHYSAFRAYSKSLQALQSRLDGLKETECDDVLWCSVLLAVFEV